MHALTRNLLRGLACTGLLTMFMLPDARAVTLGVFHADSLAGPMRELKRAFETSHPGAAVVPGTARDPKEALEFVAFLLTTDAQRLLRETGQPPVVPALRKGAVPAELTSH